MGFESGFYFEEARPCEEDARQVMEWRNDADTLRSSFHQEEKVWEKFWPEYQNTYFTLLDTAPIFACVKGERVGFLRFRRADLPQEENKRSCDLSINLSPEWRGRGIGAILLQKAHDYLANKGYEIVLAEVIKDNTPSHRVFVKAGYRLLESCQKTIEDTGKTYDVVRYVYELSCINRSRGVFIIAEAGSNFRMGTPERDWEMAMKLIDHAAAAGADAVKFQFFRPETLYVSNAGKSAYLSQSGINQDITDLLADAALPESMLEKLADYCERQNIEFMASAFSKKDLELVDPYVRRHKIASYEISHLRLIQAAAATGKPLCLSTGAADLSDIRWAMETYHSHGGRQLTLLQCTAKYPTPFTSLNLRTIQTLQNIFNLPVGLSDHSRDPLIAPILAVGMGASVIEKHFTLHNELPGADHSFAITSTELKDMVRAIRHAEASLGSGDKFVQDVEDELRHFARRGVQALEPIKKGDVFVEDKNIAILRPGEQKIGVHPKYLEAINGSKAIRDIALGSGIEENDWEQKN